MAGKMLLPYLGGAAAVWTTCVLFFQFILLIGYVYAHLLSRISDTRKQMLAHLLVLLLPLAFLPIRFGTVSTQSLSSRNGFPKAGTKLHTILTFCTRQAMPAVCSR